jgi:SAM-dependent methyltransferase
MRILEVGCGPGALARAMAERIGGGYVLGIDRSEKAIRQAREGSVGLINQGCLEFRKVSAEAFTLIPGEAPFDLAVAIRVGALDGRHPDKAAGTLKAIAAAMTRRGRLFIDGGHPLKEIDLKSWR